MPQKNRLFPFVADAHYHIYNRGTNRQEIFLDDKDYWIFRHISRKKLRNCGDEISLMVFSLLPNHYHFLLHQKLERSISAFIKSIAIRYGMYLRKKYDHDGRVFSSSYHAVLLPNQEAIDQAKEYILKNPIKAGLLNWKHVGSKI